MKHFFLALFAIFLIVLSAVLYDTSSASAAVSTRPPQVTDDLRIGGSTECPGTTTMNSLWYRYFTTPSEIQQYISFNATPNQEIADSIKEAVANGSVLITQQATGAAGFNIIVNWSETNASPPHLTFNSFGDGYYIWSTTNTYRTAMLNMTYTNGECNVMLYHANNNGTPGFDRVPDISFFGIKGDRTIASDILPEHAAMIPDIYIGEPEMLRPDYTWKVAADGNLTITYGNNIQPTLTGFVYPVIEKMTNDWAALDTNVQSSEAWRMQNFDRSFMLPSAGYYMFRMDYDDTFDSPPWEENANQRYDVEQIWVQFYWDGESVLTGTTIGCASGTICNDQKDPPKNYFFGFEIPDHGLSAIVTAPLAFISSLSTSNCSPITLPIFGSDGITLQCLKPVYQTHLPVLLALWQTVITGSIAYLVGINTFARIKGISNPKDDSIEVYKL